MSRLAIRPRSTTSRALSCGRQSASACRFHSTRRCTAWSRGGRPRGHPIDPPPPYRLKYHLGGRVPQEEGAVRRATRWGALVALLAAAAAIAALAATTGGNAAGVAAKKPIIIGAAVDLSGIMKPFDSA